MFSSRRAFTLLEIMAAMGVFAIMGVGLLFCLDASLKASRSIQTEDQMRGEIQNRLALLGNRPLRPYHFESEPNERQIMYVESITPQSITDRRRTIIPGFWKLEVTARWIEAGRRQEWTASHLVYSVQGSGS